MFKLFRSKFYIALTLMLSVPLMGVMWYKLYAGYTWLDAIYMTVITIATVGFREISEPDNATKLFTVILIASSIFIFTYSISVVTEYILARNALENFKIKKMKKKIKQLNNHVILCGYGRNGKQAAAKLEAYRRPFVVIEQEKKAIEARGTDILYIEGNANEDQTLIDAGIKKASALITALPNDADNLFIVLSARQLNKNLNIISRASEVESQKKLRLAGADSIIMPDRIGGSYMASLIVSPDLVEFLDHISTEGDSTMNIEEVSLEDLLKDYEYKSILELNLRKKTGCTVIGYKESGGNYIVNPDPEMKLMPKSKLIVLGQPEQIKKLREIFRIK